MTETHPTSFAMLTMEYRGNPQASALPFEPFAAEHYPQYRDIINSSYRPMREALDIRPYDAYSDTLQGVLARQNDVFLLRQNGQVICTVALSGNEIEELAVHPDHQRQGYGREAVTYAVNRLQARNIAPICLTVTKWNKGAIALYTAMGFVTTGEKTVTGLNTRDAQGNWSFTFTDTDGLPVR